MFRETAVQYQEFFLWSPLQVYFKDLDTDKDAVVKNSKLTYKITAIIADSYDLQIADYKFRIICYV